MRKTNKLRQRRIDRKSGNVPNEVVEKPAPKKTKKKKSKKEKK